MRWGSPSRPLSDKNYGAGRLDRVKRSVYVCPGISCIITVGLSTILYLTGGYIYLLFTTDAAVIAIGMKILHFLKAGICDIPLY
ncbi:MAG: MATE family efflux transporter [Clostridium fessum]